LKAIEVRGLERRFGATRVLGGLDLQVETTEHAAITGANGSGKTTLLRVLAGLLRPTVGDVSVLGGATDDPRVRKRIGMIGHAASLYPRMTVAENVRFWGRLYDDGDAFEHGRQLLDELGLDPDDRRPVAAYSQGMRQRASVARALCTHPDVVLADEPLAGLDAKGAAAVTAVLARCPTVVVATHDLGSAPATTRYELVGGELRPA
jgi:ABC-type multidrug transport system ATPase subunit